MIAVSIGIICLVSVILAVKAVTNERFANTYSPVTVCRSRQLVKAYYEFLNDPTLAVTNQTPEELYQLEWRKRTRSAGLPYVYDYLFFTMHWYVVFEARQGNSVRYIDVFEWIMPFVDELVRKSEPLLTDRFVCPIFGADNFLTRSVRSTSMFDQMLSSAKDPLLPIYAIYNNNQERYFKSSKREWLKNDRGGNNIIESHP
jgi:hypothetical protein